VAIFVAMVLDGLDGRVARMTRTQSAFGAEYDSLSDMVSFGVAPALVTYAWALKDLGAARLDRCLHLLRRVQRCAWRASIQRWK
jgi:phosphatidylserine synthase